MATKRLTPQAVTRYLPQFFIGLFFLAAAYMKLTEGLFGAHRSSLQTILQYWMDVGLTPPFYRVFSTMMLPYADAFAYVVIAMQGIGGILLILNRQVRLAGALIVLVQLNVYLATYYQLELRVLNSEAMLIGLYFFAKDEMRDRVWTLFTYGLVAVGFMHLAGRSMTFGDPFPTAYGWQREHFGLYVMSSWPGLKYFVLWLTSGTSGPVLWATLWWIKVALFFGMLTRYRLYAGMGWLILAFFLTLVWLNTWSCEGVMWVLTMFLWVTHEHMLEKSLGKPPSSLLP